MLKPLASGVLSLWIRNELKVCNCTKEKGRWLVGGEHRQVGGKAGLPDYASKSIL